MSATSANRRAEFKRRFGIVKYNNKWSVTMAQVGVRHAVAASSWPHWQFLKFTGRRGSESRGIVDMIAIRKDHAEPKRGTKRGDLLQIILIQVKGGKAANPTPEDCRRLRLVARHHAACGILLATWKKGKAAKFFPLRPRLKNGRGNWVAVDDLKTIFG